MTIASTITPPSTILNPTNTTEAAARQQDTYSRIKEVVGHSLLAISSVFALVTIGLYITTCVITLVLPASFLYLSTATILVMFVAGTFLIDSDTTNEELLERRPQPNTGSQTPLASGSATRESSAPKASSTLPSSSPRAKNEELQKALIGLKKAIESLQEKKVINCDYATALEVFSSSHRELQNAQILLGPGVIHEEVIPVLELCAKIRELRYQPAQKRPVTPADPHKATETEVRTSSKGLSNPSCNCFMNASLQALSHSRRIREHLIGQLLALSTKEGLPLNPLRPEAPFACLPTGLTQKDKDKLNAHFRLNLPQLKALADAKIQTTLLPLASFELSELIKLNLKDMQVTSKIYMQASLQQAAGYAHSILSKWHTGTEITEEEAILLRVSLIKIMGRPAELKLSETNSFFSFFLGKSINADWEIPGLSGADPDMSILYREQEGAGEFSRNLLESLDQLTETTNPLATVTQRLKKAYTLPQEGQVAFSDALAIPGAENRQRIVNYSLQVQKHVKPGEDWLEGEKAKYSYKEGFEGKFVLDHTPSLLSDFTTFSRLETTYEKQTDLLPQTHLGQTVSEQNTYVTELPHQLMMWIQAGDAGQKYRNTELTFTNERQLTITIPAHESLKAPNTYELTSFTVHQGPSLNAGHYVSYTKHRRANGTSYWLQQSDSTVSAVNIHELKALLKGQIDSHSPNLLIFNRI